MKGQSPNPRTLAASRKLASAYRAQFAQTDELLRAAQAAYHLCESLLSVRTGATDELITEVRDALAAAIAEADKLKIRRRRSPGKFTIHEDTSDWTALQLPARPKT